ncbi:MAG: tetratricopeptide repeat protein [Pyrinomonadaceae bacterium]|nr:tetratricopeptide repeat protein [Pyrinomonadaceae bacterium]
MKKVTPTPVLLILVLTSISVAAAQIANSSQGPRAVSNSASKASTARGKTASINAISEKLTSASSQAAQKHYAAGTALYGSGKLVQAIEAFKQAAKLQPDDPQTHYMLGMAYSKSKAYKESFGSFKRAIQAWPDWPQAHFRLGVISYVLGSRSESLKAHNNLLRLKSPLANSLDRIIKEENQATPAEGITASEWSLTETELVRAAGPGKEAISAPTGNVNQVPTTNVESRSVSAGLVSSMKDAAPVASEQPAATEEPAALTGIYRVGVGDVLDIRVLNSSTTRSTLYSVIDGGLIDIAIAGGPITVAGLTTDLIQARITAELQRRAIEEDARVSVGVRQYGSHSVIITGLVTNPGTKFLRREAVPLYVIMAEAQARLDAGRVVIMRPGSPGMTVDLADPDALNFLIRPGDMISITARPQEFYYIAGRITYPGQKVFHPGVTLLQGILAAGGVTREGDKIELSREGQDRRLATTTFSMKEIKAGKIQDPRLQPGDRIEVVR